MTEGPHYSEEEFALILQRAAELQDRAEGDATRLPDRPEGGSISDGFSLEAVRDIAKEVGLEPQFIDQAAASLIRNPGGDEPGLLGGSLTFQVAHEFPGTLTDAERLQLLDVIRQVLKHQGEVSEVMGSLEWKTVGGVEQTTVTINSLDESVGIRVFSDLSGIAALTWIIPITLGLATGGILVDALQPESIMVAASILGGGATVGLGVARTIWASSRKYFRRRAESVREEIARHLLR